MQYLIELYTPTAKWQALSSDEKSSFLSSIANGMQALAEYKMQVISMGKIDSNVSNASEHSFFAIWSFDDQAARDVLIAAISSTGWHDYFQTINAAGHGVQFPEHMQQLLEIM